MIRLTQLLQRKMSAYEYIDPKFVELSQLTSGTSIIPIFNAIRLEHTKCSVLSIYLMKTMGFFRVFIGLRSALSFSPPKK